MRMIIGVEFSDESDFDFFRNRMVDAVQEIADVAMHGDAETGEPARADGVIEVDWETED